MTSAIAPIFATSDPDLANYVSPDYLAMKTGPAGMGGWLFMRQIRDLNNSIRGLSPDILPRFEAEGIKSYQSRVNMTFGFEALNETIHSLVGIAMRDDPVLEEDVPPQLVTEWEDIDGQGTHGAIFAQHCLDSAIQDGHCAILVDYPPAPPGLTVAQEQAMGLRAYMIRKPIDQITAWRIGRVLGKRCLTMVKLEEARETTVGRYGAKLARRFRTFTQLVRPDGVTPYVAYVVEEEQDNGRGPVVFAEVGAGELDGPEWIPLFFIYGGEQLDIAASKPPLRGLAYSNLDHTQIKSDRRYSMHKCALAVPIFKGRTRVVGTDGKEAALVMSSDTGIDVSEGGGAEYLEPKGTALQALRDELTDIERRMGSQGFSMLRRDPQTQTTLGEKQMQAAREESKLARAVRSLKDALESGLGAMAAFEGLDQGGSITLSCEFTDDMLTDGQLKTLIDLEDAGKLTHETLLRQLQKFTPILEGVDIDTELKAVEDEEANEPALAMPGMVPIPPPPGQPVMPPVAPVPEAKAA